MIYFCLMNHPPQIIANQMLLVLPNFFDWCPATTIKIIAGLDVVMMSIARIRFGIVVAVSLVVVVVSLPPPLDCNNYYSNWRFEKYPPTCE